MNCGKKIQDSAPKPAEPPTPQPAVQQPVAPQYAQPQAPQYAAVAPAAPSAPVVVVKPRRNLVWIPIVAILLAGAIVAAIFLWPKSDEDKIRDRIESFTEACNDMDFEAIIACMDSTTRKQYETMMSATDGILGGITGIDLPYSDMAELMGMEAAGEMDMDIEIKSIEIDGDTANVEVVMSSGGEEEADTIIMCKEDDDWYIDFREMTGGLNFF